MLSKGNHHPASFPVKINAGKKVERPTTGSGPFHQPADEAVPSEIERTAQRNRSTKKSPIHTRNQSILQATVRCLSRCSPEKNFCSTSFPKDFLSVRKSTPSHREPRIADVDTGFASIMTATRKSCSNDIRQSPHSGGICGGTTGIRHYQSLFTALRSQNTVTLTRSTNTISHMTTPRSLHQVE